MLCKFVLKKLTHYFFDLKELSSLVSSTWGCTVGNRQGLLLLLNGSRGRVFCLIGFVCLYKENTEEGFKRLLGALPRNNIDRCTEFFTLRAVAESKAVQASDHVSL